MMACKGVVLIGYLHQPVWTKLQTFSGYSSHGFFPRPKFSFNNSFKFPKVSHVEGRNSGWNPSFLSFSVPQFGGDGRSFPDYGFSEVDSEVDESEILCEERALDALLDCNKWGVKAPPLSGSLTNFAVYTAILESRDRIMYLNLTYGGHLSHGFTSKYFETMLYRLDESTDLIDYDMLEKTATDFRPKLIVACVSANSPDIDFPRMRKIADEVGAFFMMDMTHISGLDVESVLADPFKFCDIVTTTSHKILRGRRGDMIFFKKGFVHGVDLESAIDIGFFPNLQVVPCNHTIAGPAVCSKDAQSSNFKNFQKQAVANCIALGNRLIEHGYKLVSDGSDNHMVLVDLRPFDIDGALVEKTLNMAFITLNKNLVPGYKSAPVSDSIHIGTQAMTKRGLGENEFELIADLIHEGVLISLEAKSLVSGTTVQDFMNFVFSPEFSLGDKVSNLRRKVKALATQYPIRRV